MATPFFRSTAFRHWLIGFASLVVALILVLLFSPWDMLRGPINRYVSGELGRRFEITE